MKGQEKPRFLPECSEKERKHIHEDVRTYISARSIRMHKRLFLLIVPLIVCSFLIAACGQQSDSSTNDAAQQIISANTNGGQQNNSTTTNGNQQNNSTTTDNQTGNIVHNFNCTSGISRGVRMPTYPDALHITFLQATDTANFVQDELTIQADPNSPNTFTWTLRSTGEQASATITDSSIGATNFGVTVLGFTKTLSMDPDTGQMQQATYWAAEVCDQWATDGTPVE